MRDYHLVGVGGVGMSGLARLLLQSECAVSGSDVKETPVTEALRLEGAKLYFGHAAHHVSQNKTVVYSSDIKQDNPELIAAREQQCRLMHRSELLAELMLSKKSLTVTGTHGKTTTTSLLVWVLQQAGFAPSFAIGGFLGNSMTNAAQGQGDYFVAEADESDGSFLNYRPFGAIVTNIDRDHLSHYGSETALLEAFASFASHVEKKELLFWCGDDAPLKSLNLPGTRYGFSQDCAVRATCFRQKEWAFVFDATIGPHFYPDIEIPLIGRHNALNALAVFALTLALGVPEESIRKALKTFPGVKRRCECKSAQKSLLVIDDYAHHPTEVEATLNAIRKAIGAKRMVVLFQPHRYSRTQECLGFYGPIFRSADEVFLTDIYGAGEPPIAGIDSSLILQEVSSVMGKRIRYVPRAQLKSAVWEQLRPHDVVVTLGAGDITQVAEELVTELERSSPKKLAIGVICGGISTEHEVTWLSARQVLPQLNCDYYAIQQFGVTKSGHWVTGPDVVTQLETAASHPPPSGPRLTAEVLQALLSCDVIVPLLHGTFGEDGMVQGFLDVLGLAYVGCGHRAAAVSMDKVLSKQLCARLNISTAPFVSFTQAEWQQGREAFLHQMENTLTWPLWVKPVHLGSSVEVHRVENWEQCEEAIARVFRVDTHVLVESEIRGRELEVALFGNHELTIFPPGEVFTTQKAYDYQGKYGEGGTPTAAIAEISPELAREAMELAAQFYQAAGCQGLARIDLFLDENQRYWFNEINPLPGFTRNSLYPRMCEAHGLSISQLFDTLIILAKQKQRELESLEVK